MFYEIVSLKKKNCSMVSPSHGSNCPIVFWQQFWGHLGEQTLFCSAVAFVTFLQCAFLNVFSNCLPDRMQNHTCCIYSTFLHCAFSNVSSNCLPVRIVYLYLSLCVVPFPSMNKVMVGLKM